MKVKFLIASLGLLFYTSLSQAKTFNCLTEDGKAEFFLEVSSQGNQKSKVYRSYWGEQLDYMYVLTNSKNENSKLTETYILAYTIYSKGATKEFKLTYKDYDPKAKSFDVVRLGYTYHCE